MGVYGSHAQDPSGDRASERGDGSGEARESETEQMRAEQMREPMREMRMRVQMREMGGPSAVEVVFRAAAVLIAALTVAAAAGAAEEKPYEDLVSAKFTRPTAIDNPWFPMKPGARFVWEGSSVEFGRKFEHHVVFTVTDLTKEIAGIETVVGWDQDYVDGVLAETEIMFLAQDDDGALWSLGEYPEEYEDGVFVDAPLWIHGLGDGKGGILIPAKAAVGTRSFAQGWSPSMGFTDRGKVHAVGQKVEVPFGSYDDVLVIEEWDKEEPDARAFKYYARGVGHIKVSSKDTDDQEELGLVRIEQLDGTELAKARKAALRLEENAREFSPELYALTAKPRMRNDGAPPKAGKAADVSSPPPVGATTPDAPGTEEFGMTPQQMVKTIDAAEAEISRCMREQGFQYVAVDYRTVRRGMNADKVLPGITEREFIEKHGYGISTLYTGLPPQLETGYSPAKMGLGRRNIEIYMGLSPADRIAYDRALLGEHNGATLAVAIESENLNRTGGCTRQAVEKVFAPEQFETTYVNPKDVIIYKDPRMKKAARDYAMAMRKAGFEYNHPDEVEPDLRQRLDAITAGGSVPLEALAPDARRALTELQDYERRVAVASFSLEVELFEPVEELVQMELFGPPPHVP